MGTLATLTVLGTDQRSGGRAVAAAFDEMQRLESVLTRFDSTSQLSQLNLEGQIQDADPALVEVVRRALVYGELTAGAFDISVEPVLRRYREALEQALPLESLQLDRLLELVGYRRIHIEDRRIVLGGQGMAITLDGIAKGFVIDNGTQALITHGFDQVLVEVGGDLATGSRHQGSWRVGIQSPRPSESKWVATVELQRLAMATSGDYLNRFTENYRLHHILDPRTGLSPAQLSSASVVAPSAMDADALSTSMMVLGPQAGLALVERMPQVEALLVGKNQEVQASSGFPLATA